MRSKTAGWTLFAMLGIGLAACTSSPPPVIAVPQSPLPAPSKPITPPLAPRTTAASNWNFNPTACHAKANGPDLSVDVAVSRAELSITIQTARVMFSRADLDVQIAFVGRSGNWTIVGRRTAPRRITVLSRMDEDGASRVLVLLSGGTVRLNQGGRSGLLSVRMPDAGPAGRTWFDCVKQELFN